MSQATVGTAEARVRNRSILQSLTLGVDLIAGWADRVPPGACRFLVAGGLSSLVNWLARFPLSVALPYGVAVALAYSVGMVAGFGLYRSWVFPGSPLPLRAQTMRFILVNCVGLSSVVIAAQSFVALILMTGLLGRPLAEAAGHGFAIIFGAIVNFTGHRAITFARSALRPVPIGVGRVAVKRLPR